MKLSLALALAAATTVVQGHTTVYGISVNDVDQGSGNSGVYIRTPPNNSPVKDLKGASMACNVNNVPASKSVATKAGDKITFEWQHDNRGDDIIAESHKGPIVTYLAPAASNGAGKVWVKIAEENFSGGSWPVDKLIANKGKHSVTLPKGLAPGKYIIRPEILALHESDTLYSANPARGIQLYMSCIQIEVTAGGSTTLPAGVAFPGAYSDADPGIHFDVYSAAGSSYKVPGPAVWDGASGGAAPAPAPAPAPSSSKSAPAPTSKPPVSAPATSVTAQPTTLVTRTSSAPPATTTPPTTGGKVFQKWYQCGGKNFAEKGTCVAGTTCTQFNDYYHQCV